MGLAACRQAPSRTAPASTAIQPTYDKSSGNLTRLEADSDRDGLVDTWGYMDGARVVRVEVDENGDGLVDRWEYHRGHGEAPAQPGKKEAQPGKEAQAAPPVQQDSDSSQRVQMPQPVRLRRGGVESPDKTIERIERATRRDGVVSRWEYFDNGMLTRVEEDKDGDGKIDKWETYSDGSLSTMAIDTRHRGKPDRRLVYRPNGTLDRIEVDPTGSGSFNPLTPAGK